MQINKTGIISLICGFLGLFLCWNKICIPFILIAFICGIISLTDYLGYKWTAICGMSLALLGATIVFIQIGLPFIKLYKIGEALSEIPEETTTKKVVEQTYVKPSIQQPTPIDISYTQPTETEIQDADNEIEITIDSVTETSERDPYNEDVEAVYVVELTVKNNLALDYSVDYSVLTPKVIDSQGQMGIDFYPISDFYDNMVSKGAWDKWRVGVGVKNRGDFTMTFDFLDADFNRHYITKTCKVD